MESKFAFLTPTFFTKAEVFPGSLGTFRYRFQRTGWVDRGSIQAWVYENTSFELAADVETETFDWTQTGVDSLRVWLDQKLSERGSQPYRIPYPPAPSEMP